VHRRHRTGGGISIVGTGKRGSEVRVGTGVTGRAVEVSTEGPNPEAAAGGAVDGESA
jgi:hypothetical protein